MRTGDSRDERMPPTLPEHEDPDRAPETPTDEPKPAPVQDPPAEPGRPPLTVGRAEWTAASQRVPL